MSRLFILLLLFSYGIVSSQSIRWNKSTPFTTEMLALQTKGNKVDSIIILDKIIISEDVETPKNIAIVFQQNGMLSISTDDVQVIINGPVLAERKQIFDLTAKGVLTYDAASVSNISMLATKQYYPEWWGLFPNIIPEPKGTNTTNALHYTLCKEIMLDISASGGGDLHFSDGIYYIRDMVIDADNITVSGNGIKTILRFDRKNFKYSTRRGGIFTIQGPNNEKYYNKTIPEGKYQMGNFLFDKEHKTIENIVVKNLVIEWDKIAAEEDPAMNGLSIVNAKNVTIDNVHVNLFGANRAFYIGTLFDNDVTENITIKNSSCEQSRTGVFILHGFDEKKLRKKLVLDKINIEGNNFKLVRPSNFDIKNEQLYVEYLDKNSSGIYFAGSEFTSSFIENGVAVDRTLGTFTIKNNIIENADFGIRSWFGNKDEFKGYRHTIHIEGNTFLNFVFTGIFSPFSNVTISNNIFIVNELLPIPIYFSSENEEGFLATAIHIAKAPWREFGSDHGPDNVTIKGNTIKGCFIKSTPIIVQPNTDATIRILDNNISYDTSCVKPQNDIVVTTNRRKFKTKKATIIFQNNTEDTSNQSKQPASLFLDVRRKKFITLIEQ